MEYCGLLIVVTPLLLFLLLGLLGTKLKPIVTGIIGTLGMSFCVVLSYGIAYLYFSQMDHKKWEKSLHFEWIRFTEHLHIDLGILLDSISIMMLVVISTVSLMVHIYSLSYMKGEKGFQRYYAFLSLFSFSMFGLVVATNIFQMYIFWELVGVSSYFLIGFYYTRPFAIIASKKAFIITRFADLGFLIGILLLSFYTKTFDFGLLISNHAQLVAISFAKSSFLGLSIITWAMTLILMGGFGKSAMFPLHVWLPGAMEGPTPVSALIHAATMVVAGVYLIARLFPIYFFITPKVLEIVVFFGAFTSFFAAVIAMTQTDIKRVLAFSTISQIAYMMVALGVSGYNGYDGLGYMASMFHLFTHAFFKALLFLGAGSVIHAVHSNEIGHMGNLYKKMKITNITFLIACLSISGIPPFSGFYSKDEILIASFHYQPIIFWILWIVIGLTAFYIFRLYFCIFWNGRYKNISEIYKVQESPMLMVLPLLVLSVFSIFSGLIPFGNFVSSDNIPFRTCIDWLVATLSIIATVIGIVIAYVLYFNESKYPSAIAKQMGGAYKVVLHKFYIDEAWIWLTKTMIFRYICIPIKWFDRYVIDGLINGLAWIIYKSSISIKNFQSGQIQFYAWIFITGLILIAMFGIFMIDTLV